jgi:hypothetical protein
MEVPMSSPLDFTLTHDGDLLLVEVRGVLDSTTYRSLRDGLLKCLAEAPEGIVVDVDRLEVAQNSALSVFSFVALRNGDWPGAKPVLVTSREDHHHRLRQNVIHKFVRVCRDTASARAAMRFPLRLRTERTFPRDRGSSSACRRFIASVCERWDIGEFTDDALLAGTELVENALLHTASEPCVRLEFAGGVLSVAVSDEDPAEVVLRESAGTAGGGRGLWQVIELSRAWGCNPTWRGGKVVWAVLTA